MDNKDFNAFRFIVGDVPSYILIAAAAMNDNGLMTDDDELMMHKDTAMAFLEMARHISEWIPGSDEPRFSLYDYLDACVNSSAKPFDNFLRDAETAFRSEEAVKQFMDMVVKEAERKRRTYSMGVPDTGMDRRACYPESLHAACPPDTDGKKCLLKRIGAREVDRTTFYRECDDPACVEVFYGGEWLEVPANNIERM